MKKKTVLVHSGERKGLERIIVNMPARNMEVSGEREKMDIDYRRRRESWWTAHETTG